MEKPFHRLEQILQPQSELRAKITRATRIPETDCILPLIEVARQTAVQAQMTEKLALALVEALRRKQGHLGMVDGLIHEFSLSSHEGVALMCLAEALLRIPDDATRDALIRDKISAGDWRSHLGHSPSLFVNAAAWGLLITGRLVSATSEITLSASLTRLIGKGGEPLIRKGVDMSMRMMGEHFVAGQTIADALAHAKHWEAKGFRYSYDMLGEAACTAQDATHYFQAYQTAIHAIGEAAAKRGIYDGPGISIKLSALHPRYCRAQRERVMIELLPKALDLAILARQYDIGLTIDAEESDRLDLSLDILEALSLHPSMEGWNGLGAAVQAYQKRAPFVLDFLIDLARRSRRRLMIRLVKGAYWDSEIKRAQIDGLEDFPVFTRKIHTDLSYLACAHKLLQAPDAAFPQFATHNAQTLAAIHTMAGENFYGGQYEFQCLHGMGEPLYDEVVGPGKLNRPCRIYAPVGPHRTLLAYLVRRLLENGANTSFVNRITDLGVPVDALVADPVESAAALTPVGSPHPLIALPKNLFGAERPNSVGIDLSNEQSLAVMSADLAACGPLADNPGSATPHQIETAIAQATRSGWAATPPTDRAAWLIRAADMLQARRADLIGLLVREAGKTLPNAIGEVREAEDFLRYYAAQISEFHTDSHIPLGPVACISPWNFPLAIFIGQVSAALAAGNAVLAKPAEECPRIATLAVDILYEAGVPADALHLLQGSGEVGARLVSDPGICGVMFTGSTEAAKHIQSNLSQRLSPDSRPIPLIAETGGVNVMIVDSSARPEQVVSDVITSTFDSAGQRCSALRALCLQQDCADAILSLLIGAMEELTMGEPDDPATDVGPVISDQAKRGLLDYIDSMRAQGHTIHQLALPVPCRDGAFVPPTVIEIDHLGQLQGEVFGPVLHVLRFAHHQMDRLIDEINGLGYGLTCGIQTRIDETIARVTQSVAAGNIYVNRTMIGAVVGVQPFGGQGLSGTGPKAGGSLYLRRLLSQSPLPEASNQPTEPAQLWFSWLAKNGREDAARRCADMAARSRVGLWRDLPGPVGERNAYAQVPRGIVLCLADTEAELYAQIGAALATGNRALITTALSFALPAPLVERISVTAQWTNEAFDSVLFSGPPDKLLNVLRLVAERPGPIVGVHTEYALDCLMVERSVSDNIAASGGNPSLMTLG